MIARSPSRTLMPGPPEFAARSRPRGVERPVPNQVLTWAAVAGSNRSHNCGTDRQVERAFSIGSCATRVRIPKASDYDGYIIPGLP